MTFSPPLIALANYLAGEFDNKSQALSQPAWYVHLRLWIRPVPIFREDSITLFAEQANVINLDLPYRPRILRLRQRETIEVEFYMFEDLATAQGAGQNKDLISQITPDKIKFLPDCTLRVATQELVLGKYSFETTPITEKPCSVTYQGITFQVFLGFKANADELLTYDKGIDPKTGKGTWGALMGAYQFNKRQDFSEELNEENRNS
ncbi:chromophore lyase CpcT/CpeT [Waterburya agarophytonicola K14]|uniref:Chromophore lyase CpcT/CpeT n=1 Tax=Waterburya agarophytonicola KI4 TaxID=2874699 RepID=A0A964BUP6_9CYAN|nr:chromophore lyase CpcT/CpeT [Waterburya agarophytonicola]MCC0179017.1 chromophore lyase CpcT/CpeT [Waterburya agarophytonicola KI4]